MEQSLERRVQLASWATVLDIVMPEWVTLVRYPARFVDLWVELTDQTERTGWRWLDRARQVLADLGVDL